MATITIRDLDDSIIDRLKAQARADGLSMEGEARRLIAEGVSKTITAEEFLRTVEEINRKMGHRVHPDSAVLIREDRDSR